MSTRVNKQCYVFHLPFKLQEQTGAEEGSSPSPDPEQRPIKAKKKGKKGGSSQQVGVDVIATLFLSNMVRIIFFGLFVVVLIFHVLV